MEGLLGAGAAAPESPEQLLKLLEDFERQGGNLNEVSPDLAVRLWCT